MAAEQLTTPGGITIPAQALQIRFTRSGGPGGQHVNTSATRVELVCDLTRARLDPGLERLLRARLGRSVRVVVATSRSQAANRAEAYRRLARRIDSAARTAKTRRATRPTPASRRRRADAKQRRSRRKQERSWRPDQD